MAGQFSISLVLRAVNQASPKLRAVNKDLNVQYAALRRVNSAARSFGSELRGSLLRVGAVAAGVGYALNRAFVRPAAEFERLQTQLTGVAKGDAVKAGKQLEWVREFARTSPLGLSDVTKAFVRLQTVGLDPQSGSLQKLADSTLKYGGDANDLNGIIFQMGQAFTKGKLLMQDMRPIMDRGIPVYQLLADATGRTAEEMINFGEKGLLGRDALRLLIEMMGSDAIGASDRFAKTWSGMTSIATSLWEEFGLMVADAGFFDALKGALTDIIAAVTEMRESGELQRIATLVGEGLTEAFRKLWGQRDNITGFFKQVGTSIGTAIEAVGGMRNALTLLTVYMFGSTIMAFANLTVAAWGLAKAIGAGAIASLGLLFTTVGLVVAVVALLGFGLYKTFEPFRDMVDGIGEGFLKWITSFKVVRTLMAALGFDLPDVVKLQDARDQSGAGDMSVDPLRSYAEGAPTLGGYAPLPAPQATPINIYVTKDDEGNPMVSIDQGAHVNVGVANASPGGF